MSATPLKLSKTTFLVNQTNSLILRGRRLQEVVQVDIDSDGFSWVQTSFDDPINSRYMLISGMPRFVMLPDPPPESGQYFFSDVKVVLTSRCGTEKVLTLSALYLAI